MLKVLVLTISDRATQGVYEDRSGPAIESLLGKSNIEMIVHRQMVSDDADQIRHVFASNLSMDYIITTGGTGIGPRDFTPEVTTAFCDRLIPGISEMLRRESSQQTINAVLSRGVAGTKGKTIIINLPGSVRGAEFCMNQLMPLLLHAKQMLEGNGH